MIVLLMVASAIGIIYGVLGIHDEIFYGEQTSLCIYGYILGTLFFMTTAVKTIYILLERWW